MSLADENFVFNVNSDIKRFLNRKTSNRVLLFPPVNNYCRYLIHQTCENFTKDYDLFTFSIGQGPTRRTVVCFRNQLVDPNRFTPAVIYERKDRSKNWRTQKFTEASTSSYRLPTNMGVEKHFGVNKSESLDVYRPPALRRDFENTSTAPATPKNNSISDCISIASDFRAPTQSGVSPEGGNDSTVKSQRNVRRERRPDRAVYVPRARRSQTTPPQVTNTTPVLTTTSPNPPASTTISEKATVPSRKPRDPSSKDKLKSPQSNKIHISTPLDNLQNISTNNCTNFTTNNIANMSNIINGKLSEHSPTLRRIVDTTQVNNIKKGDKDFDELRRASKEINRSNRRIIKQTFDSDVLEIPDVAVCNEKPILKTITKDIENNSRDECDPETDDWDSIYDDNGECLDPKIIEELTASVGKVKIEAPKMDYSAFYIKQSILNEEEYPHVLEVSNFPVEFKTQDLLMLFASYKESGFDIKWVDDTHALAVFSSSRIAAEVLAMGHPFVMLKPLAEATLESRVKAKKCEASLKPYRPRPETCAALARRLVTGALGVRLKTAAVERENEKRVLREAKERKLLLAKQRDEAWES